MWLCLSPCSWSMRAASAPHLQPPGECAHVLSWTCYHLPYVDDGPDHSTRSLPLPGSLAIPHLQASLAQAHLLSLITSKPPLLRPTCSASSPPSLPCSGPPARPHHLQASLAQAHLLSLIICLPAFRAWAHLVASPSASLCVSPMHGRDELRAGLDSTTARCAGAEERVKRMAACSGLKDAVLKVCRMCG